MALITHCSICQSDTLHYRLECLECKSKITRSIKEDFLSGRKKLDVHERLSMLESAMFDLSELVRGLTKVC